MRNPLKWRRDQKALTAGPAVLEAIRAGQWSAYPLLGGGSRDRILEAYTTAKSAGYAWMYANSEAVRTVVDCIVRNVGQLDLRLYEEIDEAERQPRSDHPAALSLRYPNETTTSDAFVRQLFKDFLIYDDAAALMTPAPNQQLNLSWIPFSSLQILGSSLFTVEAYRYWRFDGTFVDFPAERIFHWHGENPTDPRVGLSHLDTLRDVVAEEAALRQATIELANSGLSQPVYVYRPTEAPEIDNQGRKGLEEDLANRMRTANRRPFVLEEGSELRPYGVSPRDAQMVEIRRWVFERVAGEYGLPLGMIGLADDLEKAQKQFYADTLPPYCEAFTKFATQRICARVYDDTALCFEFNLDEKHMGDDRLTALVSATGRPVLLTNEARARLNQPPVPGGDELVTPLNVMVGDNPKPSTDVMGPQDPNGPPQDGSYRTDQPAPGKALEDMHRRMLEMSLTQYEMLAKALKAVTDPTAGGHEDYQRVPQLSPTRRVDLERQHEAIGKAEAVIERHFDRLGRSLKAKELSSKATDDWRRWTRELSDDIDGVVTEIVKAEGTRYAFKLAGVFDMRKVNHYLRAMSEGAAEAINAKIRDEIADLGLDGALGKKDQHVASAGAGLGAGATRWAREEAARQSPGAEHRVKIWIPDTQRHEEFGGDTVPLDADWPAGFAPGSAPGCRCSMAVE